MQVELDREELVIIQLAMTNLIEKWEDNLAFDTAVVPTLDFFDNPTCIDEMVAYDRDRINRLSRVYAKLEAAMLVLVA